MPRNIARVALDVPQPRTFDYVGEDLAPADIGRRVKVPFGRKERVGLLLEIADGSDCPPEKLKSVFEVDRRLPPLDEDLLSLFRFCAAYYHYPIGQIALSALPTALRRWRFQAPRQAQRYALTQTGKSALPHALPPRAIAQRRLAARLAAGAADSNELSALCGNANALLQDWLKKGWLEIAQAQTAASPPLRPQLLPAQQNACDQVAARLHEYAPFLLHGITGSGKTEVYLHLVEEVLARGRQALILVPEIGLTPQFTQRVTARFPAVATSVLHSGLAEGERLARWRQAVEGEARIVLGTRLAVFTPLPELGLIIVDEEHDASFSQQEGLRYSARDLAVFRARQRNVPVLLGSATPSLESWFNAEAGRYTLLALPARATGATLPELGLVDTRQEKLEEGLSRPVLKVIGETLARGEQALVFINRRGYAPVLHCSACAWVAPCPRCSTRLTLHLREQRLRCHHCGHEERIPAQCPSCGNPDIRALGHGTQRVEDALARHFPAANIVRADRDATRRKGSWESMQAQIRAGSANLIVGTQLIAKGHDFPNLTLVVVLDADGALFSLDFRAEERLFAQLMQVAGRAGRADKPGRVLIQTGFPQHPLYAHLLEHDFAAFAREQLQIRRQGELPPHSHQAVLRAEAVKLSDALDWLGEARALAPQIAGVKIFQPVAAPMLKKAGLERAQLWLQAAGRTELQQLLRAWMPGLYALPARNVRWHLDVDPAEN
ncbi:MAG: primosomal protein N' [Pseudomonadota bacterium]